MGAARRGALTAYGLVTAAILWSYLQKYPIPEIWAKAAAVFCAVWLSFALHAVGRGVVWLSNWLVPVSWIDDLGEWNARLFRGAIGFALVTFSVVTLGWAIPGSLSTDLRIVFGLLAAASLVAIGLPAPRRIRRPMVAPVLWTLIPAAGLVASFFSSFSPITHYDSLVYHLALPETYLRIGRIDTLPLNLYSAFPGACEALFTFILGVLPAPEYTINVFGWIIALVLGGAVAEWAAQLGGRRLGWLASFIWWTMPPVLLLSQGAYVDIPLAVATYLAVRAIAAWITDPGAEAGPVFAGFFTGLAVSIKYTGGITAIILLFALFLIEYHRRGGRRVLAFFIAASAILPAPWLLKNFVALGNPVFPFLYEHIPSRAGWSAEAASGYFRVLTEYTGHSNLLTDLLTPWRTASNRGGFDVLGDFGWPFLILAALPAFFLTARREIRLLWIYFMIHSAAWYVSKPVLRFLTPALPFAVILAAATLHAAYSNRARLARVGAAAFTAIWIVTNVFLYGLAAGELKMFTVPFGASDADTFLRRRLAYYPTYELVNHTAAPGEGALVIGEQRTYGLHVPFLASNVFSPSPISELSNQNAAPSDISSYLIEKRINRIIVNEGEIERLGGLVRFGFTPAGESALRNFLASGARKVSTDRRVDLYEIPGGFSVGKRP